MCSPYITHLTLCNTSIEFNLQFARFVRFARFNLRNCDSSYNACDSVNSHRNAKT